MPGMATRRDATSPPVTDSASPSVSPRSRSSSSTTLSIVSSSTANTRSPRIARRLALLGLDERLAPPRVVAAFAVMRTTMPSMPRARKAIVGFVCASTRSAIISARPDSDAPHVFSERDTIAACSPARASRSGSTCSRDHQLHLVGHAGHRVDDLVADRGADARARCRPSSGWARRRPGCRHWRRLLAGMSRPRPPNSARDPLDELLAPLELDAHDLGDRLAGDVVGGRPEPAAHDDRVGCVEQLAQRLDHAGEVVADLAVLVACRCRPAASCSPIQELFVSTIWPSSSSVPIASTSHLTPDRLRLLPAAAQDVEARRRRDRDRDPQHDVLQPIDVGGRREQDDADGEVLDGRLPLPELARRQRDAARGRRASGRPRCRTRAPRPARPAATRESPRRPSARNPPRTRTLSASGSRNAPERVVPSRRATPAVDAVGAREHEPQQRRSATTRPARRSRTSVGTDEQRGARS